MGKVISFEIPVMSRRSPAMTEVWFFVKMSLKVSSKEN